MSKTLVIKTSMISDNESYSTTLLNTYVEAYKKFAPEEKLEFIDLNKLEATTRVMNSSNLFTDYFTNGKSDELINQLKGVNKVIMAVPMTNFNINAVTKVYFDHINVANKTFSYKYAKKGDAVGLLDHLDVQILTTQGAPLGWYPWGNHTAYLKGQWEFFGAKVFDPILVHGTKIKENADLGPKGYVATFSQEIESAAKKLAQSKPRESKFK
ncbi:FMN-dependent NADH-azoreductase [Mycoplasma testudineum]|uniref:FMN dependent NADH:quinone oxidoreductase n=1 Tax=Mycoplasma testudineum TaxID=244584 RepID=A0A4R6IJJ3_9MOLU|nr:FMN-dependent NADH-azoreductase [Mycoplasma testudineum]OYD26463.1 FMN-dependent NADH-azoreductase [Mycoplasma testudineum]TDO22163.1 FMN-dependent NADH-azoreductase [Mycoplasma testudineum]